jgi:hypothetical protein
MMAWLSEDDNGAVAVCLGVSHLCRIEQQRAVKLFMARMTKRLQRHFESTNRRSRRSRPRKKFNG